MKNSILIAALLAAAVVCSALYAAAADPLADVGPAVEKPAGDDPTEYERGRGRHFDRMAAALELTPEQREQVRAIRAEEWEKTAPLRQQLREGRDQLHALINTQPFDEAAVRTLAEGQAELRTELIVSKARMKSRIHALLTPEQREKAETLRSSKGKRGFKGHRR